MQLKEILAIENDRTDVTKRVIHLFQEGSFYRAYEWSAWLCHRYINQFKVTYKQFRGVDTSVLFVGFPVTSLPKYAGDSVALVDVDEKLKDILLPGAYLKPWRRYVSNCCLGRMAKKIRALNRSVEIYDAARHEETFLRLRSSLNSFLGVLSHYKSKTLRTLLMYSMSCFFYYGRFDENVLRYERIVRFFGKAFV